MTVDIWKIGQDTDASKYFDTAKKTYFNQEIIAAQKMTNICNQMADSYDKIIADQNDYILEIDANLDEISTLTNDLETKIKQLEKDIAKLLKKKEDGTITEEEEAELESKTQEIRILDGETKSQINNKNNDINKIIETAKTGENKTKNQIATDYGNVAVEKGQPMADTKDKRKSFWRKAFGGWDKSATREAGKNLVDAGTNLLEQAGTSLSLDKKITSATKKSVHK